jgi:hypothetical protein
MLQFPGFQTVSKVSGDLLKVSVRARREERGGRKEGKKEGEGGGQGGREGMYTDHLNWAAIKSLMVKP